MRHEINEFCQQRLAEGCSRKTGKAYGARLGDLLIFLRRRGIGRAVDVLPKHLDAYVRDLVVRRLRAASIRAYAGTARTFFGWLARQGRILRDPARGMRAPAEADEPLPEPPLAEAAVADLLDGLPRLTPIDRRNRLQMELLYGCGLRIGESLGLDLVDVQLSRRALHVRGKGRKERLLPLPRGCLAALRNYLPVRPTLLRGPDHGALLLNRDGRRLTDPGFRAWLARLNARRVAQGLRSIHPHILRHAIATHLLRGGADIRYIQAFLGHSDLDTSKVYLRLVPGRLKEAYGKAMPSIPLDPDGGA